MAGKGSRDTRVKNRKQFRGNFEQIKFPSKKSNEPDGFIRIKGNKITKKY